MSLTLLLEGVRAHLAQSVREIATAEVVDKLMSAATIGCQSCAQLTSLDRPVPGDFTSMLAALRDGNSEERLNVVLQLRLWANQMPDRFELAELPDEDGLAGDEPPNLLVFALAAAAQIGEDDVRIGALQGLGELGHRVLPVLAVVAIRISHITSTVNERRESARVLGRSGHPEAAWPLLRCLDDPEESPLVKSEAAAALGALGPCASFALPSLLTALGSESRELRRQTKQALLRIDPKLTDTSKLLNGGMERRWFVHLWLLLLVVWRWARRMPSPACFDAARSAELLGRLGREAAGSVPQLLRAVGSWTAAVRMAALEALARIAPGDKKVRAAAEKRLLLDPDPQVRIAAASALEACALAGLSAEDVARLRAVFQLRMRTETDGTVRHRLSQTAERLWGVRVTPGTTAPDPSLEQLVKKQVTGNIVSLIFRFALMLLRKVFVGC